MLRKKILENGQPIHIFEWKHLVNGGLTYTYDTAGRRTAMSAGNGTATFANAAYTYDAMGRIATVGNSADTLTYSYVPGTGMVASSSWQTATVNTAYTYDSYKRLTNIAVNNTSVYGYTLNDKNQRTGATLPDGRTWSYSYDTLGQLTGAVKRDSANTQLADLSYLYDQIGNRTSATENNTTTTYTSNLVNQYTQIASQVPTYDADGNMTSYNGWTYTWNGENRLVAAENSDTRLEFSYDYMGRRLEKKVYGKGLLTLYDWSLEKHRKFIYDGYKLIAEFDALASDTQLASYLWQPTGLDVPLMRIADNTQTYYIADGNKNIIALKDSSGADVSTYAYTPFGSLENPADGDENPFRFSSEYADDETGLVYYNYRYYSPQLGRWTKRDPIEEQGGSNLYALLNNNSINFMDKNGEISLASKIMTRLGGRVAKIPLFGLSGVIHNWISYSDPIVFEDEEKEVASFSHSFAPLEMRTSVNRQALRQTQFIAVSVDKFNAAKKYGYNGVITISGDFPSTEWWLGSTSVYMMSIEYKARCQAGWIYYKDVKINYEWHDNIDANSFIESYKAGNLFSSFGGFVSNTLEGMWDIVMDKIAGVDYKIIIKGHTSISDGQFPRSKQ